jgi:2-oxoglutarate ferredoxin oxidoreductase subunit delta
MQAGSTKPKKQQKRRWKIEINENLCKGCEICIEFCPFVVFGKSEKLNRKGYYVPVILAEDKCNGCKLCDLLCPELAIVLTEKE